MIFSIILFCLGAFAIGAGVYVLVTKYYDKKKESKYTLESIKLESKVSAWFNVGEGVAIIIVGLSHSSFVLPQTPFYYIGWVLLCAGLIVDSILETKLLKKLENKDGGK